MSTKRIHPIRQWLAAERAGRDADAERALVGAFRYLADPEVSPRFARAVMARIGGAAPPMALGWRLAIAAVWLVMAISLIYVPWVVVTLRGVVGLGGLLEFGGETIVRGSRALVSWLTFWQTAGEVSEVLLSLLSRPVVAAVVVVTTGLATVALRLLWSLMATDGSRSYV